MLRFVTGGAGFGKSTYLIDRAAELADKGKKVVFIVPEQFSFESDKKLYKALGVPRLAEVFAYLEEVEDYFHEIGPEKAADILLNLALEGGGRDNISLILAEVTP